MPQQWVDAMVDAEGLHFTLDSDNLPQNLTVVTHDGNRYLINYED